MANYEATKYDFSGASLQGVEGVNTGLIVPWGNNSTPSGFLDCDGSNVSRTTYANLFAVIGTTYGVGDGSTTFGLPDLTDKTIVGKSPTKALASTGGANTVVSTGTIGGSAGNTTLTTPTIASHSHSMNVMSAGTMQGDPDGPLDQANPSGAGTGGAGGGGAHSHPLSASFTGDSRSVLQPYITTKYIIKT